MAYTKTCKIVGIGTIAAIIIIFLCVIFSVTRRLCPKGELMHRETSLCYPEGSKGPCPNNLVITEEEDRSQYGACSCDFKSFNRTLLYHKDTETCYFVFTQAYCKPGEWLYIQQQQHKWIPSCMDNFCSKYFSDDDNQYYELVPVNRNSSLCARLGVHEEWCPEGEVVRFHRNYVIPTCNSQSQRRKLNYKSSSIGVPASKCRVGSYPSIIGKCQPQIDFDFD